MATYHDIAYYLAQARINANKTQQDAAAFLGVTFQAVSNWERGYSKIDSVSLLKLLFYYGVDVYDFMEKSGFASTMSRADHSDFFLPADAREVAERYMLLPTAEQKNMIRGSLGLPPLPDAQNKTG